MPNWADLATQFWMSQPAPDAPELTNGEYPTAVKLATHLKFGGHANAQEATAFWHEYQSMNQRLTALKKEPVSPDEFTHLVDNLAKVSFTFHGRPPTMHEIAALRDAPPAAVSKHYADLPDSLYPHVSAGQMVKALQAATTPAMTHLGRPPNKLEAAQLVHSGQSPWEYYQAIAGPTGIDQLTPRIGPVPPWGGEERRGGGEGRAPGGIERRKAPGHVQPPVGLWPGGPKPTPPPEAPVAAGTSEGGGGATVASE